MANPLLVFRVGYMKTYQGPDTITGGGAHIAQNKAGGEMWNFQSVAGKYYGYVMTGKFSGIDLGKVVSASSASKQRSNSELSGIDVVFIARRPFYGQVVVGWYLNATVFHKAYRKRPNPRPVKGWRKLDYLCEVDEENAVLLPESDRTEIVPYAPAHGKGYPGHSNVWYGQSLGDKRFIEKLRNYISRKSPPSGRLSRGFANKLDRTTILAVEKASMEATVAHFEREGYTITPVHRDYCGWDLTAKKGRSVLQLEVKGHIGDVVRFELTPNEYAKMAQYYRTFRVCLVRNALSENVVEIFSPKLDSRGGWELHDNARRTVIKLNQLIGARAIEAL